jgi:hypothetical protein
MHVAWRWQRCSAVEALSAKPPPDVVRKFRTCFVPIPKLWRASIEIGKKQLECPSTCAVLLHLRRTTLRIVSRIDLKLLAEAAFKLISAVQL